MDAKQTKNTPSDSKKMSVTLRTVEGLMWPLYFEHSPVIIGRGIGCDVRLPYPWISLQHLEIIWSDHGISVRDLYAKTPVHIKGKPLSTTPTAPTQRLSLSLPSISLDLSLYHQSHPSNIQDQALMTRRLWRPESGWLLWTLDQPHLITLRRLHNSSQRTQDTPPKPILSHTWHAYRPAETINIQTPDPISMIKGQCWFLPELGTYQLTSDQSHLHIVIQDRALMINSNRHSLPIDRPCVPISLELTTFALSQTPHPPIESLLESDSQAYRSKRRFLFFKR
jgi:hypothetical protein